MNPLPSGERVDAPTRHWLGRASEPYVLFPGFALLVVALAWVIAFHVIRTERATAEKAAAASARELVDTYEAHAVRVMHEIDKTLKLVQYAHESTGRQRALEELKARELLPPGFLFTVSLVDPRGAVVATTGAPDPAGITSRDELRKLQEGDSLIVGLPRKNPATGDWTLQFSRRLSAADGSFAGIVVLAVDAAFFVSDYDESKLGRQGMLGVVGADRIHRALRIGAAVSAGSALADDMVLPRPREEATEVSVRRMGGVPYYTSVRRLHEYPLAVMVGIAEDEYLAGTRQSRRTTLGWAGAGSLLLLGLGAVLSRMSWQIVQSRKRIIDDQVAHAERVEYLAYHDSLTQLPNRSLFSKLLNQGLSQAHRYGRSLAVMFLDLDGFKHINDTLGHDAGDRLLKEIAARLKGCMRESDVVARLGGDEFVVLLPELSDSAHLTGVAQKILSSIAQPVELQGQNFHVTSSIGIAAYPQDGKDEQTLTKHADIAMYKAKQDGKNNFQFYSEKLNAVSLERLTLESSLRQALLRDEFQLYYQEKRDIHSGRITGMEALLRWNHPELGLVTPMDFLPAAEESGLIVPIGRWVIRAACAQNVAWQRQGLPRLSVAVNLTARQFAHGSLVSDIRAALEETGMAPQLLELEISESVLIRDTGKALRTLGALKDTGVRLAIDDFGVGYSSLSVLRQFPLDTIKIDRSFIREIVGSAGDKSLANAVIAMGRSLSMMVVAQGIETGEQANILREHACDELQGFYFSRPSSAGEFATLLQAQQRSEQPSETA